MEALMRARRGGALFPVLILATIMLFLTAMLPQVLVSASQAMRNDDTRQHLLYAAESGVAFAEARLKRRLADDLVAGIPPQPQTWKVKPTFDNPDYGQRKPINFEARLLEVKPKDTVVTPSGTEHRFAYRLESRAWDAKGRDLKLGVNGLVTVKLKVDSGRGGMVIRTLDETLVQAINREER